jgi:hypothetical protein
MDSALEFPVPYTLPLHPASLFPLTGRFPPSYNLFISSDIQNFKEADHERIFGNRPYP